MGLSGTAHVILGMLGTRPMSGYEIKQAVDRSTRFFWAASYGQIYPELRRLARDGLIEGEPAPRGARRRTVYTLTRKGETALDAWLEEPPEPPELRFEGLLKLFFLRAEETETARLHLQTMKRQNDEALQRLRELRPAAGARSEGSHLLVLQSGITAFEAIEKWLEEAERRVTDGPRKKKPKAQRKRLPPPATKDKASRATGKRDESARRRSTTRKGRTDE